MKNRIFQIITMFYPFHFSSSASKDEIIKTLHYNVEYNPSNIRSFRSSNKEYEGVIQNEKFKFKRIERRFYTSFLPQAHGKIISDGSSTSIKGVVRCHIVIYVTLVFSFLLFLLPLVFGVSEAETYSLNQQREEVNQMLLENNMEPIPTREPHVKSYASYVMPVLFYVFIAFYFNREREILIGDIKAWINAREVEI